MVEMKFSVHQQKSHQSFISGISISILTVELGFRLYSLSEKNKVYLETENGLFKLRFSGNHKIC